MTRRAALALPLAATALLIAGCGSNSSNTGPVAPTPTAAPTAGPVTLKLVGSAADIVDVDVVWNDDAGALLGQSKTDAAGEASFVYAAGAKGMVTVAKNDTVDQFIQLQTFTDLGPGDTAVTSVSGPFGQGPQIGAVKIDFADAPPQGTVFITIDADCNTGFIFYGIFDRLPGYVLPILDNGCPLGPGNTVDVLVTAYKGDFLPLAFALHKDIPIAPKDKSLVAFPDGWRTDFAHLPLTYSNAPAGFGFLSAGVFPQRANGVGVPVGANLQVPLTAGGGGGVTLLYPADLAAALEYQISLSVDNTGTGPGLGYSKFTPTIASSVSVDLSTLFPPVLTSLAKTNGATVRPGATWTAAGSLSSTDFGQFALSWRLGKSSVFWDMIFPATTTPPLRVPELPDSLASLRPTGDDGTVLSFLGFADDSRYTGYHQFIGSPFQAPSGEATFTTTTTTPTGTSAQSALQPDAASRRSAALAAAYRRGVRFDPRR